MSRKPAYEKTSVAVGKTIGEIREMLQRFNADQIATGEDADYIFIIFRLLKSKQPGDKTGKPPEAELPVKLHFSQGKVFARLQKLHPQTDVNKLKEQSHRTVWRQAYYYVKAVLETVELGLFNIYQGFLAGFAGPDGRTLGEVIEKSDGLLRDWAVFGQVPLLPEHRPDVTDDGAEVTDVEFEVRDEE